MIDSDPFYTNTVQCKFWNGTEWKSGIAFNEFTIDGESGEVFLNASCAASAQEYNLDDWIIEYEWYDLNKHFINENMN